MFVPVLKKFTIKQGAYCKEGTIIVSLNLMSERDTIRDIVDHGIDPAEFVPGISTKRSTEFENILLTDSLFNIDVYSVGTGGVSDDIPAHTFQRVQFKKVSFKMEGKGTDTEPSMPILYMEFVVACEEDLALWLFNNLEDGIGMGLDRIPDPKEKQRTLNDIANDMSDLAGANAERKKEAGIATDPDTGEVVNTETGEVLIPGACK